MGEGATDREDLTALVSHDLRTHLQVASARLELARLECDSEHLAAVDGALSRMNDLLGDLSRLSGLDEPVSEPTEVDLARLARETWAGLETGGTTLDVEAERPVLAEPARLQTLLENLLCNAVTHGGETVTLVTTPSGFAVEDDGPGMDPTTRERAFESGVSSGRERSGLGLSIVRKIASAHGWTVSVEAADGGGTRFAFADVSLGDP